MTTVEQIPLHNEAYEQLEDSEAIAAAVVERALLFSELGGDIARHRQFREKMGIKYMEFGDYFDGASRVIVADDTVQESGAFKSRGAASAALASTGHTLVAASAGNHGNGLAVAGRRLGKQVVIEVAADVSPVKVANMTGNAAVVNAVHESVDAAMPAAQAKAEAEGVTFVHPYDDLDVIAGQATAGLEMLDQLLTEEDNRRLDLHKDPIEILLPIGGGGLITGVASVFYWAKSVGLVGENLVVRGVQMEGCDAMRRTVAQLAEPLFDANEFNSACDGTAVTRVGKLAQAVVSDRQFVQDVMTVSEAELGKAMRELEGLQQKRIEPAGALSMAGAQKTMRQNGFDDRTYLTMSTGKNVSTATWQHFMEVSRVTKSRSTSALGGYVLRGAIEVPASTGLSVDPEMQELHYDALESLGLYLQRRNTSN